MESNFNLGSLKIVQTPLMEYFKDASKSINETKEAVGNNIVNLDIAAIGLIGKIQKTLKMIGLNGFAKVLKSSEEALLKIQSNQMDNKTKLAALEVIGKIIDNGSLYIKTLTSGALDQPVKFFDDYKAVNEFLGKKVFVKELFSPKLDFAKDFSSDIEQELKFGIFINENNKATLLAQLKKVNHVVQTRVVEIEKVVKRESFVDTEESKQTYKGFVKNLFDAFEHMQKLKISKNTYIYAGLQKFYLCVLSPSFNNSFDIYLDVKKADILEILNDLKFSVNNLYETVLNLENGEKTGTLKLEEATVNNLVFELLHVLNEYPKLKEMPVFEELNKYFDFSDYQQQLADTKIDLISSVISQEMITQSERLFNEVKEEFTLLGVKKSASSEAFLQQLQKVMQLNNKLTETLMQIKEVSPLFHEITQALSGVKSVGKLSDALEKELSLALVLGEYGINNFVKNYFENKNKDDFVVQSELQIKRIKLAQQDNLDELAKTDLPKLDSTSKKSDERKAFTKIFDQVHQELVKVEETLDMFLRSDEENSEDLPTIIKPLAGMKGIFTITGKPLLSNAIDDILKVWNHVIKDGKSKVNQEQITDSISLVSGLSLYVTALKDENDAESEEIYDNIMKKFSHLDESLKNNVMHNIDEVSTKPEKEVEIKVEPVQKQEVKIEPLEKVKEPEQKTTQEPVKEEFKTVSLNSNIDFTESPNDEELAEFFLIEATEVLDNMTTSLKALDKNLNDSENLSDTRRYFHTLKGSGRMVGLEFFGEAGWMVEQTLNKCVKEGESFTPELLEAIKWMKGNFDGWVQSLKDTNSVTVDLVSVKKKFLELNPNLTNHVEIHLVDSYSSDLDVGFDIPVIEDQKIEVEMPIIEETRVEFVEDLPEIEDFTLSSEPAPLGFVDEIEIPEVAQTESQAINLEEDLMGSLQDELINVSIEQPREYIEIDGKEVSISLYELFNEESEEHIKFLKEFVEDNYGNEVYLSDDFMRHAHTLASISRTVNMQKIAKIAALVEGIANTSLDQNKGLKSEEMNVVRHAVNSLENFKTLNNELDVSYFENIVNHLDVIHENLLSGNGGEEIDIPVVEDEPINVENIEVQTENENNFDEVMIEDIMVEDEPRHEAPVVHHKEAEVPVQSHTVGLGKEELESLVKSVISSETGRIKKELHSDLESLKGSIVKNIQAETEAISKQLKQVISDKPKELNIDGVVDKLAEKMANNQKQIIEALNKKIGEKDAVISELSDTVNGLSNELKNALETINQMQEQIKLNAEANKKYHGITFNFIKREMEGLKKGSGGGLFGFLKK